MVSLAVPFIVWTVSDTFSVCWSGMPLLDADKANYSVGLSLEPPVPPILPLPALFVDSPPYLLIICVFVYFPCPVAGQ